MGRETRGRKKETAIKPAFVEPGKTSGNDGEMRLVTTKTGPKLKVKYQNKWWQMDLADPARENVDNFIPRVWVHRGKTPAAGALPAGSRVYLPKYITTGNIIGLSFGPSLGFEIFTFWWRGGDSFTVGTAANGVHRAYQSMIHYEKLYHTIRLELTGGHIKTKEFILSVYYKP